MIMLNSNWKSLIRHKQNLKVNSNNYVKSYSSIIGYMDMDLSIFFVDASYRNYSVTTSRHITFISQYFSLTILSVPNLLNNDTFNSIAAIKYLVSEIQKLSSLYEKYITRLNKRLIIPFRVVDEIKYGIVETLKYHKAMDKLRELFITHTETTKLLELIMEKYL